ncbi:hypothetical protein PMAYCL1PPCAC_31311 [Pristionchus mayeri]|uniref:Uncharacterized protein n=1 Tax=Pristionchus mayeri TaxID=1317129 RepID=A0AAN5DCR9_9BILA|nr:hypothetical protein PMAYCL1PPCAC_31311 [Pristionchus mayeri]
MESTQEEHLASVTEPPYVERTYHGGAKCNVGGDTRRKESTLAFECNRRFVSGYVHIAEVAEEHPCKYRLQLQSSDFCDNDWLLGVVEPGNYVRCRIYYHPERIKPLMRFLDNYEVELDGRMAPEIPRICII